MSSIQPTLLELQDALSEVTARWYDLGLRLGLSTGTLDAIQATSRHVAADSMRGMLRTWLEEASEKACWSDIVTALRALRRNDVADKVAKKYCNSTGDSSQSASGNNNNQYGDGDMVVYKPSGCYW